MDSDLLIGIGVLLLICFCIGYSLIWLFRLFFKKKTPAPLYEYKGVKYTRPLTDEEKAVFDADINHKRKSPFEREIAMMNDLEGMTKKEAKEWLEDMKLIYDYGEIPSKAYAKAMCIIQGKEWLTDEEYENRINRKPL